MVVVVVVRVAEAVDVTNFVANSGALKEALKSATILKSLSIHILIYGEAGVGKKTLASYILPNAKYVDFSNLGDFTQAIKSEEDTIFYNFKKNENFAKSMEILKNFKKRFVLLGDSDASTYVPQVTGISIYIPPLKERPEDIHPLIEKFYQQIKEELGMWSKIVDVSKLKIDLSQNANSLKRSVYLGVLTQDVSGGDIEYIFKNYLYDKIGGKNDYRDLLPLFEKPLIEAELERFGSQLQISKHLGLNRNTVRKKIEELL